VRATWAGLPPSLLAGPLIPGTGQRRRWVLMMICSQKRKPKWYWAVCAQHLPPNPPAGKILPQGRMGEEMSQGSSISLLRWQWQGATTHVDWRTGICCLTFVDFHSSRPWCHQVRLLARAVRENSRPASASQVLPSLHRVFPVCLSVPKFLPLPFKDTGHVGLGTHPTSLWPHLN
jgi:hypothetical protein